MKLFSLIVVFFFITFYEIIKPVKGEYDEDLIVNKFLPMAAAAFGVQLSNFKDCINSTFGSEGMLVYSTYVDCSGFNFNENDKLCAALIAVSKLDKAIIVSFRYITFDTKLFHHKFMLPRFFGTINPIQFLDQIGHTIFAEQTEAFPVGKANFYFQNTVEKFEEKGLFWALEKTMKENPSYELWMTGHSLGGSLAALGAGMLVKKYKVDDKKMKLVTFGAPRTGNSEWAEAMDKIIPYKYRIVQGTDIVPHIPFQTIHGIGFRADSSPVYILEHDYLHYKGEIWYPEGTQARGKFIVCNGTNEDENCSNKNYNLLNLAGSAIEKIVQDCQNGMMNSGGHQFKFLGIDIDIGILFNKVKDGVVKIYNDAKNMLDVGITFIQNETEKLIGDIDKFTNALSNCFVGTINGFPENMKKLLKEHETYFGIFFKGYGGNGCRRTQDQVECSFLC